MVSSPIIQYYYTQFIGDAISIPTIKATATFQGIAVIDSDPYIPNGGGANWYTNQNNFFRQIRNFVIDLTSLPSNTGTGVRSLIRLLVPARANILADSLAGGSSY
jgi:glucan 1,3-beta-glucosidase